MKSLKVMAMAVCLFVGVASATQIGWNFNSKTTAYNVYGDAACNGVYENFLDADFIAGKWGISSPDYALDMAATIPSDYRVSVDAGSVVSHHYDEIAAHEVWNPFTFELWVKPTTDRQWSQIINNGATSGTGVASNWNLVTRLVSENIQLQIETDSGTKYLNADLTDDEWSLVTVRYLPQPSSELYKMELYVNGVRQAYQLISYMPYAETDVIIGNFAASNGAYGGIIDEVRYTDSVLDPSGVDSLLDGPMPSIPEPSSLAILGASMLLWLKRRKK